MAKTKKEKTKMTKRQLHLFMIIILGSFFEGLDDSLVNIALPYIGLTFGFSEYGSRLGADGTMVNEIIVNPTVSTYLLAIIGIGTVVAFLMSRLADRVGRRPVFLWCVYGYSICTFLTAVISMPFFVNPETGLLGQTAGLFAFGFFQFTARIFLIGSWSLGYVILTEEFAAKDRGFATGRFQLAAVFGGLLVGILIMFFIPKDTIDGFGWQWLYMIGAIPLIPVFFLRKWLPETEAFLQRKRALDAGTAEKDTSFMEAWKKPHRKYLIIMSVVWFFFYFGIKGQLNLFSTRVVEDLHWVPSDITIAVASATVIGIFIIALNGKLLDILGRKKAALIIILVGVAMSFATFMSKDFVAIIVFNVVATGCLNSFLMIGSTITNELFPTKIRASAMAWANNIFGRVGQIGVPLFVGAIVAGTALSWGNALAIAMLLPLISLVLIMVFIPETSKRSIEEIDGLDTEAAPAALES
ncbi:MAG: MFS transporter [Coriobacteriia bacterium]|nr:MFS transporter [Coriobacteriia bacterium]